MANGHIGPPREQTDETENITFHTTLLAYRNELNLADFHSKINYIYRIVRKKAKASDNDIGLSISKRTDLIEFCAV